MRRRGEAGRLGWLPKLSAATATSLVLHVALLFLFFTWFRTGGEVSAPLPSYTAVLTPKVVNGTARTAESNDQKTAAANPRTVAPAAPDNPSKSAEAPAAKEAAIPQRLLAPAPEYKPRISLEKGPVPLVEIEPKYPAEAGGVQGTVVLRLLINETGGVDNVEVASAFPPALFDAAAIEAFREATFSPGRQLGVPVKSQLLIEVKFQSFNKGVVGDRALRGDR